MNRSIYMDRKNQSINLDSRLFTSTINNLFRSKPKFNKNGIDKHNNTR